MTYADSDRRVKLVSVCKLIVTAIILGGPTPAVRAEVICDRAEKGDLPDFGERVFEENEIVTGTKPVIERGEIICENPTDFARSLKTLKRYEIGLVDNLRYYINYNAWSAFVRDKKGQRWDIFCSVNVMDDTHQCQISRGTLWVIAKDSLPTLLVIGKNHFPGSQVSVRIDKHKMKSATESSGFSAEVSADIIESMKTGAVILYRYQAWPYEKNIDGNADLAGFAQAYKLMLILKERIGTSAN